MIEVLMIMTYETCKGAVIFNAGHRGRGNVLPSRIGLSNLLPIHDGISKFLNTFPYKTHSAVRRSNTAICKRMRSATDKSKISNGCIQKHKREKRAALFLQ